jgi:hypothetical protein
MVAGMKRNRRGIAKAAVMGISAAVVTVTATVIALRIARVELKVLHQEGSWEVRVAPYGLTGCGWRESFFVQTGESLYVGPFEFRAEWRRF